MAKKNCISCKGLGSRACYSCKGTGKDQNGDLCAASCDDGWIECPYCEGLGQVDDDDEEEKK